MISLSFVMKTRICVGRTICGPQCVPKSTYVTLAHKRKPKFFYFGCSLVRRFYCKMKKLHPITGRTDRRTDRVRRNMRPPPREEGRIKSAQRDANTARALAVVRFGHSSPARCHKPIDRTDYNTLRRS